ncbi:MAG: RraA family protein [Pseudomonadota bacterium]
MSPEILTLLRRVDTPTVCNAIEVAQGQRGFDAFTRGTTVCSEPEAAPIVGYARTATIRGARPSDDPADAVRARRRDYLRHMASGPRPAVTVIEDLDHPACVGAWWGEVHVAVHRSIDHQGALTNGLVRDLGSLAEGFPVIAGGVGVSHAYVHVVDFGIPVQILGLTVNDGDLLHADRHGAVVIPPDVLPGIAAAIDRLNRSERLVLDPALQGKIDIDTLLEAWGAFEKSRT